MAIIGLPDEVDDWTKQTWVKHKVGLVGWTKTHANALFHHDAYKVQQAYVFFPIANEGMICDVDMLRLATDEEKARVIALVALGHGVR